MTAPYAMAGLAPAAAARTSPVALETLVALVAVASRIVV